MSTFRRSDWPATSSRHPPGQRHDWRVLQLRHSGRSDVFHQESTANVSISCRQTVGDFQLVAGVCHCESRCNFSLKDKNHVISSFNLFWIAFQVVYVVCAIGGGACSAASSNSFGVAKGVPVYMGLLGGIVMLWGARFAAGCTRYVVLERQYVLQKILYHITCVNFTRGGKGGGCEGYFVCQGW